MPLGDFCYFANTTPKKRDIMTAGPDQKQNAKDIHVISSVDKPPP